jgi:hypothetical protein
LPYKDSTICSIAEISHAQMSPRSLLEQIAFDIQVPERELNGGERIVFDG